MATNRLFELFQVLDDWDAERFPSQVAANPPEVLNEFNRYLALGNVSKARQVLTVELNHIRPVLRLLHFDMISFIKGGPEGFSLPRYASYLHTCLAKTWMKEKSWKEAQENLLLAIAAAPDDVEPKHLLVELYCQIGQFTTAIVELEHLVKEDPGGCAVLYDLALNLHQQGIIRAASDCYRRVTSMDKVGLFCELASKQLDFLVTDKPLPKKEELEALYLRGFDELNKGNDQDALADYLQFLSWDPQNGAAWFVVGYIYQQRLACSPILSENEVSPILTLKDSDEVEIWLKKATQAYQASTRSNPELAEAHHQLANSYLALKLPKLALDPALKAASLAPNDPNILADLGLALFENNSIENAEQFLQQALLLNPHDPLAHLILARVLSQKESEHEHT